MEDSSRVSKKRRLDLCTRSADDKFDWKKDCFICGQLCHDKKRSSWSLVQAGINENSKLYSQLIEAAERRKDGALLSRLLSTNGDLVAVEARYHRKKACIGRYMNTRKVNQCATSVKDSKHMLIHMLKDEFMQPIEEDRHVYQLTDLKKRFFELANEKKITVNLSTKTSKFKQLLISAWPNLRFHQRTGYGYLVYTSSLSIGEAVSQFVAAHTKLTEVQAFQDVETSFEIRDDDSKDENSILYSAAQIIRNRVIKHNNASMKEYFSENEVSISSQKQFLDPILIQFVQWLCGKQLCEEPPTDELEIDEKIIAIASDITSVLIPKCITPKHLGLTVHLHHTFGSKKLIEELSKYGHTLPYTELRHFLTSAAHHVSASQQKTPSGTFIPMEIVKKPSDNKHLIIAAADNWDHNESTLSGKKSTHAMTSLLVIPKSLSSCEAVRIPRIQERSIKIATFPGGSLYSVLPYIKPSQRPKPVLHSKVRLDEFERQEMPCFKKERLKELLYNLGRCAFFCDDRAASVPPWTVFQSHVQSDAVEEVSTIAFNPIIMATPTDFSTIYTVLKRTKEQMNTLGQTICPIVFDMGLLTKALEVVWANPIELEGVLPMEGGMHFLMACFSGIGFLYGDIGLKELLYESDVFAKATADHILSGKDFDRAMRAILMVDETLSHRFLFNFQAWLVKNNKEISHSLLENVSECLANLSASNSDTCLIDNVLQELDDNISPLIEQFRGEGRENSPLFQFWDDFLVNVSNPIKHFLSSSRHGMWDVCQYSKLKLLPFFFASNRSSYAKYMTYMHLSMNRLNDETITSFRSGNFVTKLSDGIFNSVWMDYALEVTENKALKSSGGIIGLTHNDSALTRWFMSRPITAKYSVSFQKKDVSSDAEKKHHTESKFYQKMFNEDILKMTELFNETFIDPFSLVNSPSCLVNFATGVAVEQDAERSLLSFHQEGLKSLNKFVEERFVSQDDSSETIKTFYDPLPKSKVKLYKPKKGSLKLNVKNIPIGGEEMYLRLLAINSFKKVKLERVMAFENAPVPLSMFSDDGNMVCGKKSDFMEKLESIIDQDLIVNRIDHVDSIIFDGMAIIQMLPPISSTIKPTYSDMGALFWKYILSKSQAIKCIHVVFDSYWQDSIKAATRERRGEVVSGKITSHIHAHMKILDWKKMLNSCECKSQLTKLYTKYICENAHVLIPEDKSVYVSGGLKETALCVRSDVVSFVSELKSNHEEADTRMLLHVKYGQLNGNKRIVVCSPDTDVLVLLIHHYRELGIQELFLKTGRRCTYTDYTRYIPIHSIIDKLNIEQRNILLTVYCLTGCDTCSAFFGIGKKKAFKVLVCEANNIQGMSHVGTNVTLSHESVIDCVKFIGILYGENGCTSLNKLRTNKVLKNKSIKPKKLPPTDDSFLLHLRRCLFQLLVWRSSLSQFQSLPSPLDFGYIAESGIIRPQLMNQTAAPPELLSDLVCACLDNCTVHCVCSKNEQPCTQACECNPSIDTTHNESCQNIFTILAEPVLDQNILI